MLSDEERVELIVGDEQLASDAARAEAELIAALLADPATWADPPDSLAGRVVDEIRAEATLDPPAAAARPAGRPAHTRRGLVALLGAAAAAVIALGFVFAVRDDDAAPVAVAALASETDPAASGSAKIFDAQSGFAVYLDLAGLPRLPDGGFYEAWVRDDDGTLVSIGTFSESAGLITLWSGVDPCEYGTITITRELSDGDATSSGDRALAGPIDCPA